MIFEKIREKLDEECWLTTNDDGETNNLSEKVVSLKDAIDIINQVEAEYNNGWVPCSERLPEESGEYLTWVRYDGNEFRAIDEIDCDGMTKKWNCSFEYEVIAWQPLPQPPKGE